jgi:ParB family chromosome partitioning protein
MARPQKNKQLKKIPLDLIDDPVMLKREDMGTEEEIMELGKSLKELGQIQAIVLFQKGDRYGIIAGHRRVYAARRVAMLELWAEVIEGTLEQFSLMRFQENRQRLQANPYEEACFLQEMLDNFECSQVDLAGKLGVSAAYVAQRLAVLRGYAEVREALRRNEISFSQCRELMQFPDELSARQYLEITMKGGAKPELLRQWRNDIAAVYQRVDSLELTEEEANNQRKLVQMQLRTCEVCSTVMDPIDIVYMKVCHLCQKTLVRSIEKFQK